MRAPAAGPALPGTSLVSHTICHQPWASVSFFTRQGMCTMVAAARPPHSVTAGKGLREHVPERGPDGPHGWPSSAPLLRLGEAP